MWFHGFVFYGKACGSEVACYFCNRRLHQQSDTPVYEIGPNPTRAPACDPNDAASIPVTTQDSADPCRSVRCSPARAPAFSCPQWWCSPRDPTARNAAQVPGETSLTEGSS